MKIWLAIILLILNYASAGVIPVAPDHTVLIFVSFSMPDESIIADLRDANKMHASVIIRGLINNSFKETFAKIAKLVTAAGGGGIELNPLWFKQFNITAAPTVVVINKNNTFDKIAGNISLAAALTEIKNHRE